MAALPGPAGKMLGDVLADPATLTKDPGKALEGAAEQARGVLQGVLPSTTNPSAAGVQGALPDLNKAAGGLGGLLGGDKGDKKEKKDRKETREEKRDRNNR
jgi:hypothetical protein